MEKMSNFFKLVSACAAREDILLQIYDGFIVIYVGEGTNRAHMMAKCGNEDQCKEFLHEITEGKYAKGKMRAIKTAAQVKRARVQYPLPCYLGGNIWLMKKS